MVHLGGIDKGVCRAAGPPLRAEPDKLRAGMGGFIGKSFGTILAEVGGEDCTLELSDSSLCSMSLHVSRSPLSVLMHTRQKPKGPCGGEEGRSEVPCGGQCSMQRAVCHAMQAVGYHTGTEPNSKHAVS